jgi:hypothetical protein
MAQQPLDETKQPSPTPSTETNTTTTTHANSYLSTHLIVPYIVTTDGTIKRPEHLIAWWSRIFSFYIPDDRHRYQLRYHCRLFRDSLKPPPLWTSYPHRKYPRLNRLMDKLNSIYQTDPNKAPKLCFFLKGTFRGNCRPPNKTIAVIKYPIKMIGAGQNKTVLSGYTFRIEGTKEEGKRVILKDFTISAASKKSNAYDNGFKNYNGLEGNCGLSFLCENMTFTQCGGAGVYAMDAKGRLKNCVITKCGSSGIQCVGNALIELEGNLTRAYWNGTNNDKDDYGLNALYTSSRIHLLFPLKKKSVSSNNRGGRNYGGDGEIAIVDNDGVMIEIINKVEEEEERHCWYLSSENDY